MTGTANNKGGRMSSHKGKNWKGMDEKEHQTSREGRGFHTQGTKYKKRS